MPELWKAGPAEVSSGQAQRAMYLLKEDPLLFDPTVEEELEALREQREAEERQAASLGAAGAGKEDTLTLRRRISEVRRSERARIVTELLYAKVCYRFRQLEVPLVPPMRGGGDVKFGAVDLKGLTSEAYSEDALELVRDHLFRIIGLQGGASLMGGLAVVQIALFQAGQVYAMSALFGYYLRRVDARYQLEKLAGSLGAWGDPAPPAELLAGGPRGPLAEVAGTSKSLKDYIASFGPDQLHRMTAIASAEAQMAMELQVSALFGDLQKLRDRLVSALGAGARSNEEATGRLERAIQSREVESLLIASDDLRRLILEAVAFGAVLGDAEKQVDSLYELTPSSSRPLGALAGDDEEAEGRVGGPG